MSSQTIGGSHRLSDVVAQDLDDHLSASHRKRMLLRVVKSTAHGHSMILVNEYYNPSSTTHSLSCLDRLLNLNAHVTELLTEQNLNIPFRKDEGALG